MKRKSGFSLIELMVVIVVVGILSMVAYPAYENAMKKSRRGSAQAFMMEVAQREQSMILDRRSYVAAANNAAFPGALGVGVPSEVSNFYDLDVNIATCTPDPDPPPPCFRITATPKGQQVSDGALVLTSRNTKTRAGDAAKW
jgi:type IV pilus assembly protein PilE